MYGLISPPQKNGNTYDAFSKAHHLLVGGFNPLEKY